VDIVKVVAGLLFRSAIVGGQGGKVQVRELKGLVDMYQFEPSFGPSREAQGNGQGLLPK
jgi:hypothetical protein